MAVSHVAALDHDVLGGHAHAPSIAIPPGVNGNAVIASIEITISDEHIRAGLRITTISIGGGLTVRAGASDRHSPHCDIGAKHRMHLPHGRIPKRDALNEHILAAIGLDKLGTQVMAFAEYSLLHGNACFSHFKQQLSILTLIGITFFPAALIPAFPRPPVLTLGIAINRAAA